MRWRASLSLGGDLLFDVSLGAGASWDDFGVVTLTSQRLGASLTVFLTESFHLTGAWSSRFLQVPAGLVAHPDAPFVAVVPMLHSIGVGLGVRL